MAVIHWAEIQLFNNIRKYVLSHPEILNGKSTVTYKCKVKLHGTNAAVQVHKDGRVIAQSRTTELAVGNDNAGFAKWVADHEDQWRKLFDGMVVFGEWCGKGIQKGVAVSDIPSKIFAVFAARYLDENEDMLYTDPNFLAYNLIKDIPGAYSLPWHEEKIEIDWSKSDEELAPVVAQINDWVMKVEQNDPWVEATFGVKGVGEGLVFYPYSTEHLGVKDYANLSFKAKGEKHRVVKAAAPVQVNSDVAASVDGFIDMFLTSARCEQGVSNVGLDMKMTGKFVAWMLADIEKESKDELEAAKLEWKQVQKALTDKARAWYLLQAKK